MEANQVSLEWHNLFELSPSHKDRVILPGSVTYLQITILGMLGSPVVVWGKLVLVLDVPIATIFRLVCKSLAEAMSEHDPSKHVEVLYI